MGLDLSSSEGRIGNRQDLNLGLAYREKNTFFGGEYPLCKEGRFNPLSLQSIHEVHFLQNSKAGNLVVAVKWLLQSTYKYMTENEGFVIITLIALSNYILS